MDFSKTSFRGRVQAMQLLITRMMVLVLKAWLVPKMIPQLIRVNSKKSRTDKELEQEVLLLVD